MSFRLVPKSVTLNDLERLKGVILRYFSEFRSFRGALRKSSRSLSHLLMSSCYLKGKGLDTWYSSAYTEMTYDQQRFTVTEVATDRQEPILTRRPGQRAANFRLLANQ